MTTVHTRETIDFDLTGVWPVLGDVTVERRGFSPVLKVPIEAHIRGVLSDDNPAVWESEEMGSPPPLTITASAPALRALATDLLLALDRVVGEVQRVANTPPHGQVHGG